MGFPNEQKVGIESAGIAFILLLHYDKDYDNLVMGQILLQALLNGDLLPENFAWIVDRRLCWGPKKLKPFYYQLPEGFDELTAQEIKDIDERRYRIGCRPLSELSIRKTATGWEIKMEE